MLDDLFGDLCETFSCVFDHKSVIQNEITHFLREFEDKRGDSDMVKMKSALTMLNELNSTLPDHMQQLKAKLIPITKAVTEATSSCNKLVDDEAATAHLAAECINMEQRRLNDELKEFDENLKDKSNQQDRKISDEVERLKRHYKEIECNFKNT